MRFKPPFLWLGCLVLMTIAGRGTIDPGLREDGVFYLEDDFPQKITTTIKAPTSLYMRRDFQTILAFLNPGQSMELIGFAPEGYLVKGSYRNNAVLGWIHPVDLPTGFDVSLFAKAKKNEEMHAAISVAIANKTVIPGMTPDEVIHAVGHPTQTSSRSDAAGSTLAWIFTTYREEPQYTYALDPLGRPLLQTYYVRIPIGQLIVNFNNGMVSQIEENKTNPNSPGVVTN